jgi:hypothetical protein
MAGFDWVDPANAFCTAFRDMCGPETRMTAERVSQIIDTCKHPGDEGISVVRTTVARKVHVLRS